MPRRELAGLVQGIWDVRTPAGLPDASLGLSILPIPAVSLAFQYGHPVHSALKGRAGRVRSTVAGIRDAALTVQAGGGARVVVANLTTLGARRLFRQSPAEFADLNLDLRLVLPPSRVDAIEERLAEAPSGAARIALVESFLVDCLQEAPGDRLVARAVELMQVDCWYRPVGELARALEIGERQLERRFLAAVGATPKKFARILRLRQVLEGGACGRPWAEVAQRSGYFDQAHLVREFSRMTGLPPGRFLRAALDGRHHDLNRQLGATVFSNTFFI